MSMLPSLYHPPESAGQAQGCPRLRLLQLPFPSTGIQWAFGIDWPLLQAGHWPGPSLYFLLKMLSAQAAAYFCVYMYTCCLTL